MISGQLALKINNTVISNMGMAGSAVRPQYAAAQASVTAEKVASEELLTTKLINSMVSYLVRIDQSLKKQTKTARAAYNHQLVATRETNVEVPSDAIAVPVAANDNTLQAPEEGKSLGLLATGLIVGGTTLLLANYQTVMEKLSGVMGVLGLGVDVANQRISDAGTEQGAEPEATQSEMPLVAPPAAPKAPPPKETAKQREQRNERPMPMAVPSTSGPANPAPAATPSQPQQPTGFFGKIGSFVQSISNKIGYTRPTAPTPAVTPEQLPSGDIVALGKYLQGQGYTVSENPAFGKVGEHEPGSRHYTGNAIDLNLVAGRDVDDPAAAAKFDALKPQLEAAGYSVLWRTKDHYDHMHVSVGGPEGGLSGMMAAGAAAIQYTLEETGEMFAEMVKKYRPTNVMTKKIEQAALQREIDIMSKKRTPGQQQGAAAAPSNAAPPVPAQTSMRQIQTNATGQYLYMFLGEAPNTGTPKSLTQAR